MQSGLHIGLNYENNFGRRAMDTVMLLFSGILIALYFITGTWNYIKNNWFSRNVENILLLLNLILLPL